MAEGAHKTSKAAIKQLKKPEFLVITKTPEE
jgi:hypothetical protein